MIEDPSLPLYLTPHPSSALHGATPVASSKARIVTRNRSRRRSPSSSVANPLYMPGTAANQLLKHH